MTELRVTGRTNSPAGLYIVAEQIDLAEVARVGTRPITRPHRLEKSQSHVGITEPAGADANLWQMTAPLP
jgi:hypothetical protein